MRRSREKVVWAIFGWLAAAVVTCLGTESHIGRDAAGRPVLFLDGKPASGNSGRLLWAAPEVASRSFGAAGLDVVWVFANLGMYHSGYGYVNGPVKHMRSFWRGRNDYDDADLDKVLAAAADGRPGLRLMLELQIGNYPELGFRDPDEVYRDEDGIIRIRDGAAGAPSEDVILNDRGEAAIVQSHFMRFDSNPPGVSPGHPERYAISFFSERWRREACAMLAAFVERVEASPYGRQVAGYVIAGGQDGQLYAWSPPNGHLANKPENWGDYSPVARRAFVKWVERKYAGDLARLNQAWQTSMAGFEEVTPPPASDLAGGRPFHDPIAERRAYDWKRFLAEGRAELIDLFAATVKKAARHQVVIGAYGGGDGGHRRENTTISRLLRSPNLDFFNHQATYGTRLPPSVGGINAALDSYAANGKLFVADMDHRLWTRKGRRSGKVGLVGWTADTVGHAADMQMQRDMWRREMARLWISGNNGANFSNMGPGTEWDNAELQEELNVLERFSAALAQRRCKRSVRGRLTSVLLPPKPRSAADVAFVFDEAAVDWARGALGEFHGSGLFRQWPESHASGVPIGYYYAEDLREGKVPPAKLVVLQNLLDIDDAAARRIRALRRSGTTIVLLQGTGMVQLRQGQTAELAELLGIRLRPLDTMAAAKAEAPVDPTHPLLAGDTWNAPAQALNADRYKEVEGIALTVDDPRATVLGLYPESGFPAAAVVESENGGAVVFIGAYTLSREAISRLAGYACAWRVARPGTVIAADSDILMVHPLSDGPVEIVLKAEAALVELEPGNVVSPKALKHTLQLQAGRTCVLRQSPVPTRATVGPQDKGRRR